MSEFKQSAVSLAVWPWSRPKETIDEARATERNGLLKSAAAALGAVIVAYVFHGRILVLVLLSISLVLLLGALLYHPLIRAFDRLMQGFGRAVGTALTWLLLLPLFYLFFTPARYLSAMRGSDAMHRKFPGPETSYWIPEHPPKSNDYYRKQY